MIAIRSGRSPAAEPGLVELQQTLYDSRNPTRRWLHRARLERILTEIELASSRAPATRAIEVGPGAGPYLAALCERFDEVVATDIEAEYLDHVHREHGARENLSLRTDDITRSRLEPESFDLVLCTEVIEHIPDPAAALRGIFGLLRPGGRLILSTPQRYSTVELCGRVAFLPGVLQVVRAVYREPVLPTGHISLLTLGDLEALLRETGYDAGPPALTGFYLPLIAELGGERAMRLERALASRLATGPLSGLLWTQYWIADRPPR